MNDRKNLLVTLADSNFIDQAKQLFSSAYFNAGWEGDYLLLSSGLSESDKLWFENKGILVYDRPFLAASPLGTKAYPPIMLTKFYLFQKYFKKWHKIIYLDADIIVSASLNDLLARNGFNAPNAESFRLRDEFISNHNRIREINKDYRLGGRAFCAGIFVFDSDLINDNTFEQILTLYHRYQDIYKYSEESTLNLFFYKKWHVLPLTYNSAPGRMNWRYGIDKKKLLSIILHFACEIKPWYNKNPYALEWFDNLERAERIDLSFRPLPVKIFSAREFNRYGRYLKFKKNLFFIRFPLFMIGRFIKMHSLKAAKKTAEKIDKQLGRIGLTIKKRYPALYANLLKFKKNKKNNLS